MMLGKFHPVDVPLWGEIGRTVRMLCDELPAVSRDGVHSTIAGRWDRWRTEKAKRSTFVDPQGRMHPAAVFASLSRHVPDDAVISVDVGDNTYAFGHYFECSGHQDVLMSGYLGSIGHGFPAAMGAWAAVGDASRRTDVRKVVSVSGDGGFGQYLADFTTAVKYEMNITHVLLNNDELGKISREQISALRPVWQTSLQNPDFAEFARICGGTGFSVSSVDELDDALAAAMAVEGGPALVEVRTSARDT